MVEETFEEVCLNIRACLNSSQRQTSVKELNKDYISVLGSSIPYRKLGYRTLEELVEAVPNLKFTRIGGELFIDVKPDEKTIHITNLVKGQKSEKKKTKSHGGFRFNRPPPPPRQRYHEPVSCSKANYNKPKPNVPFDKLSKPTTRPRDINQNAFYVRENYDPRRLGDAVKKHLDSNRLAKKYENLKVTLDYNQNSKRNNGLDTPKNTSFNSHIQTSRSQSQNEDHGYSSMSEIPPLSIDIPTEKGDAKESHYVLAQTYGHPESTPAAIMAAARALKVTPNESLSSHTKHANSRLLKTVEGDGNRSPFQMVNLKYAPEENNNILPSNLFFNNKSEVASPVSDKSLPGNSQHRSKMTDLKMFKHGPETKPILTPGSYCQKLLMFTAKHGLPCPEFTNFHKYDPKRTITTYVSRIKIGDLPVYSSLPFDSTNLNEVHEYVAKLAMQDLKNRYENTDPIKLLITNNTQQIISRITEIVSEHERGLLREAVEEKYKSSYKEILPLHWLDIVKNLSLLSVEEHFGRFFVYPAADSQMNTGVTKLPPFVLPEINDWPVFITCCHSTKSICFRIIIDDEDYETIFEKMEKLYDSKTDLRPAEIIKEGNYYATKLDNNWFRVKTLSGGVDQNIEVVLIDHGDIDYVPKDSLFPLEETLAVYPPQAVRCGLTNLEQYHLNDYVNQIVYNAIFGRTLIAHVYSRNPHLLMTLVDTSTDADININQEILTNIEKDLTPPVKPAKNLLADVYLTSVQEDGSAFIQIISDGLKSLNAYLHDANQELKKNPDKYTVKSASELVGEKVFLVKYAVDDSWYRATIKSLTENKEKVEVVFIDYGNVEIVPLNFLVDAKQFTPALVAIPPQAVQVQLLKPTMELFTESVIEFLMGIAQNSDDGESTLRLFIMKALSNTPIPDVELFLRNPDSHSLVSLNDIIGSCFPNYKSSRFQGIKLSLANSLRQKIVQNRPSEDENIIKRFRLIPNFTISQDCQSLSIYVTLVFNPSNFIVQPWDCREKFLTMTKDMNKYYSSNAKPEVDVSCIREGEVFALRRGGVEGDWCRGLVTQVMQSTNNVSVKYLDYGDSLSISYTDLHVLLPCFRELPALALKAELAGVKPLNDDWNMQDCIRFSKLISQKTFVAVPVDVFEDRVSLILIDTNADPQMDIGAVLIEEGSAKDETQ